MESGMFSYPFVVFLHHFQMCEHEKYIIPSPTLSKKANSPTLSNNVPFYWAGFLLSILIVFFFKPSWLFILQYIILENERSIHCHNKFCVGDKVKAREDFHVAGCMKAASLEEATLRLKSLLIKKCSTPHTDTCSHTPNLDVTIESLQYTAKMLYLSYFKMMK